MSNTLLTHEEHIRLMEKANLLPVAEAARLRQRLEKLYERYNIQIVELFITISAYEEIAERVKYRNNINDN